MDRAAKTLISVGALSVLCAVGCKREPETKPLPAAQTPTAPPPPPAPTAPPVVPKTSGPSCDYRKSQGICVETLSDYMLEKTDGVTGCERGGTGKFSNDACDRTGSFGMCSVGAGYMGRVMFFYESTKLPDQAAARSNCEVGLHGVFTPIGTPTK